jgi:hypothetical protein
MVCFPGCIRRKTAAYDISNLAPEQRRNLFLLISPRSTIPGSKRSSHATRTSGFLRSCLAILARVGHAYG